MTNKETNEAFMERIINEIDLWQEDNSAVLMVKFATKIRNRKEKENAANK